MVTNHSFYFNPITEPEPKQLQNNFWWIMWDIPIQQPMKSTFQDNHFYLFFYRSFSTFSRQSPYLIRCYTRIEEDNWLRQEGPKICAPKTNRSRFSEPIWPKNLKNHNDISTQNLGLKIYPITKSSQIRLTLAHYYVLEIYLKTPRKLVPEVQNLTSL